MNFAPTVPQHLLLPQLVWKILPIWEWYFSPALYLATCHRVRLPLHFLSKTAPSPFCGLWWNRAGFDSSSNKPLFFCICHGIASFQILPLIFLITIPKNFLPHVFECVSPCTFYQNVPPLSFVAFNGMRQVLIRAARRLSPSPLAYKSVSQLFLILPLIFCSYPYSCFSAECSNAKCALRKLTGLS